MKKIQTPQKSTQSNLPIKKVSSTLTKGVVINTSQTKKQIIKDEPQQQQQKNILSLKESLKKEMKIVEQKKKIFRVNLKIQNELQITKDLNDLIAKLKNNTDKFVLNLNTSFTSDAILLKFSTQFIKVSSQIYSLIWASHDQYSDQGQSKCIGDLVGKLTNTYRLDLDVRCYQFRDQGVISLAKGLSKLNNLHILNLNLPYDECAILSEDLTNSLVSSLQKLPNLEILKCEVLEKLNARGFKKLSNLQRNLRDYYDFDYDKGMREEEYLRQSTYQIASWVKQDFENYENRIVSLSFNPYIYEKSNEEYILLKQKLFIQFLLHCFDLPYLTQFLTTFHEEYEYKRVNEYQKLLFDISRQRFQQVLITLVYQQELSIFQDMNPKIILTDLWFN